MKCVWKCTLTSLWHKAVTVFYLLSPQSNWNVPLYKKDWIHWGVNGTTGRSFSAIPSVLSVVLFGWRGSSVSNSGLFSSPQASQRFSTHPHFLFKTNLKPSSPCWPPQKCYFSSFLAVLSWLKTSVLYKPVILNQGTTAPWSTWEPFRGAARYHVTLAPLRCVNKIHKIKPVDASRQVRTCCRPICSIAHCTCYTCSISPHC